MIFKWRYAVAPDLAYGDELLLGEKVVGNMYQVKPGVWRAFCALPESGPIGHFIGDYRSPGLARSSLEEAACDWVNKAALWRDLGAPDTMVQNSVWKQHNEPAHVN
ncbi:hypothetical protein VPZ60_004336 [Salmonella enterica]|nr:hypothetical protein [Salmonella enterica]